MQLKAHNWTRLLLKLKETLASCQTGKNWQLWQLMVTEISKALTHSMVQSPSWEANWFSASQEIPCISRNPKVHYRTHKRPPPVSILGQPNPVHIPTSYVLEIHPNTGSLKKMDRIWNPYNLKSTIQIYMFGILKCSEKFKVLDLP